MVDDGTTPGRMSPRERRYLPLALDRFNIPYVVDHILLVPKILYIHIVDKCVDKLRGITDMNGRKSQGQVLHTRMTQKPAPMARRGTGGRASAASRCDESVAHAG